MRSHTTKPNISKREPPEVRLLSKAEVLERVGRTFPTIWTWMQQGKFPRARDLGGRPAWLESEIEAWINNLPVRKLKGDWRTRRAEEYRD
jgi:predicted DNA-binding transcriptional regulator AlpA